MFVIKYHAKGYPTKYFGMNKKIVSKKDYAMAFGEGLRERFKQIENEHCTLETLDTSDVAEMMYRDTYVRVEHIKW